MEASSTDTSSAGPCRCGCSPTATGPCAAATTSWCATTTHGKSLARRSALKKLTHHRHQLKNGARQVSSQVRGL